MKKLLVFSLIFIVTPTAQPALRAVINMNNTPCHYQVVVHDNEATAWCIRSFITGKTLYVQLSMNKSGEEKTAAFFNHYNSSQRFYTEPPEKILAKLRILAQEKMPQ